MISVEDESDGEADRSDSMDDSRGSDYSTAMASSSTVLAERTGEMLAMPGAPVAITPFGRVQVATDLHLPPSNWLYGHPSGATRLKGFSAMPHYTGFSSFRMAGTFVDSLKDADVVADAESIKKLLKMPYSKASISLIVHKVGKALLIDDFDPHRFLLRASESEWHQWVKKFFDTVMESNQHKEKVLYRRSARSDTVQERNLVSKFLYRSLECSDPPAAVGQVEETAPNAIDVVKEAEKTASDEEFRLVGLPLLPEPRQEDKIPDSSSRDFARTLMWNFEDIRMLIGSDMPIFGDSEHPCVSLRLHNSKKPINILTGLDYWLDNLMCQVPEVMMCYHLDGIVQKYEMIKTEDLPNVQDCKFSPKAVRDVAKNILAFLKSNAAKEGHTYWLFKSKDDDIVKLYDLTTLCSQSGSENGATENSAPNSSAFQDENPFRTAVSMLLYKVARNILQGDERKIEERTVRQLLENCLKLLDTNKFPNIATSVHFMLSDVYIPNDVDPSAPEFPESAESVDDSDSSPSSCQASDSESESQSPIKVVDLRALKPPNKFRLRSFEYKKPPEISRDVRERCRSALHHVLKGLNMIDVIVRRKDEETAQARKRRENLERDNLRMSRPNEPIPMPYEETEPRQTNRPRFNSEGAVQPLPPLPWHDHLKMVLLKKAFLIYVIYAEMYYAAECFGGAIRCVKRAFNCYKMVRLLNHSERQQHFDGEEHINLVLSFVLGVAGDSYMCMVKHWTAALVTYQESYSTVDDDDIGIAEHVEQYVDEELRDWMIKFPKDIEEALLLSHRCLSQALKTWESVPDAFKNAAAKKERENLLRRLGNANNEVGVLYMTQAATLAEQFEGQLPEGIKQLFEKSLSHLSEGIENFAQVGDRANRALLNSNSGRLCRICAYCYGHANSNSSEFTQVEQHYYKRALDFYTDALVALGSKKNDPRVWDAITYELSGTYFTLGTQLQDYAPLSTQPQPEVERQVIECYQKALKYSDLETGGPHQVTYQFRAATMHHRLASLYHHSLRNNNGHSDSKMAHLRQLAELHYSKSAALFRLLEHLDAQLLRVQLERVGLHEFELERTSNATNKQKIAVRILEILCDCRAALASLNARKKEEVEMPLSTPAAEKDAPEAVKADENAAPEEDADKLLALFIQRVQHILLILAKMMTSKKTKKPGLTFAKELYALSLKCTQDAPTFLSDLLSLLVKVEQSLSSLK